MRTEKTGREGTSLLSCVPHVGESSAFKAQRNWEKGQYKKCVTNCVLRNMKKELVLLCCEGRVRCRSLNLDDGLREGEVSEKVGARAEK